jgi:ribosomal protein S18 acetylase RimI-like enzyme
MTQHQPDLRLATRGDLEALLPLVRAYHEFESVVQTDAERRATLQTLLGDGSLGKVWLIGVGGQVIGYIALCFGYSIEFQGKDAFVDEFFIAESWRGQGIGGAVIDAVCQQARHLGVKGLHLEVDRNNGRAKSLYRAHGFDSREQFHMMSRAL